MSWGVAGFGVSFGATTALAGVDLDAVPGRVAAVVGGDGAGKTTLLRALAGVALPAIGEVRIPKPRRLGYVPASGGVYRDLTVDENLDFVSSVYRVHNPGRRAALLGRTDLARFSDRLAGNLSGGMRRKLAVIGAMLHQPDLLVLDEPTTGIDPVSRADLWRLIAAATSDGAAVVVSSAYLEEAERAASILVLHDGHPVVSGTLEQVLGSMPGSVVETPNPRVAARAWRSGSLWREWLPEGDRDADQPRLEDVVIVAALRQEEAAA